MVDLLSVRLEIVQAMFSSGELEPNIPGYLAKDGKNHVFKVITGAGNGSKRGMPVLKYKVEQYLKEKKFDFYSEINHGNFYVRFKA